MSSDSLSDLVIGKKRELGHVFWCNIRYIDNKGNEWTKAYPFVKEFNRFIYKDVLQTIECPWHFSAGRKELFESLWKHNKAEVKNSHFNEWLQVWLSWEAVDDNWDHKAITEHITNLRKQLKK